MADYRVRGYMAYKGLVGAPPAACSDTWLTACAAQGAWLLRSSGDSLKIEGPSTGFAPFKGKLIDCPEAIAAVSSDSSGKNLEGDGTFPPDEVSPSLVPATPFLIQAGGNPNSLQIRTLGGAMCIHEFTVRG